MTVAPHLKLAQIAFGLDAHVLGASPNGMGVWTHGCSQVCPGCMSGHFKKNDSMFQCSVERLITLARAQERAPARLTVSGGEPTEQATSVLALIEAFRNVFPNSEVVLYTGLPWAQCAAGYPEIIGLCDVVCAGPYVHSLPSTPLTGSDNQDVMLLTPRARADYRDWMQWAPPPIQVGTSSGHLVAVGVTKRRPKKESGK